MKPWFGGVIEAQVGAIDDYSGDVAARPLNAAAAGIAGVAGDRLVAQENEVALSGFSIVVNAQGAIRWPRLRKALHYLRVAVRGRGRKGLDCVWARTVQPLVKGPGNLSGIAR